MNAKLKRDSKESILMQIGSVKSDIQHLNRKQAKLDRELELIPRKIEHLHKQKRATQIKISNKQHYIKQLEDNLEELKQNKQNDKSHI